MKYANIIVDISVEKLDKTFQYSIPENLQEEIQVGVQVDIPFGNRKLTGYVIELTEDAEFDPRRIRPIISVHEGSVAMESQLIALAGWMRKNYGSTMNQALKTVLPIRRQTKEVQKREIVLLIPKTEAQQKLALFEQKHYTAKARLLRELIQAAVGGQIVGGILLVLLVPGLEIRHFIKMIQDVNEGSLRRILLHSGIIRQKHQVRQFAGCHGQIQLFAEPAGIDSGHF